MDSGHDPAALLQALPDVVFVIDGGGALRFVSASAAPVLGWDPAEWIGRSVVDLVHEDDIAVVASSILTVQGKELGSPIEVRVRRADGGWRWLEVIGRNRLQEPGVDGVVCVARDLTRRRMWEVAANDVACFQQVVQHAASITLLLDAAGVVRSVNGAFTRLLGHDPSVVVGQPLTSFVLEPSESGLRDALARSRSTGQRVTFEAQMRVDGGSEGRPVRFELVNLLDDPVVAGIVATGHDVSELQAARWALENQARSDALTGLANRTVVVERLEELLADRERFAVLFVDLDRFKPVNDLLGHDAGDELLRAVGERLRGCVRSTDLVARVGGDEFVVVAPKISNRTIALAAAAKIDRALAEPFSLRAGPVRIGASVGVAVAEPGATVAGLLADADMAMYDTKADRRGDPRRPLAERRRTTDDRRRLVDELECGIDRGEIVAYLQPIVDVASGRTLAMEALARWDHPERGLLWPSAFLELAEYTDLNIAVGDAVLGSACDTLRRVGAAATGIELSVNLSAAQLSDPQLCQRVQTTLARHQVPFRRLIIEITERTTDVPQPRPGYVSPEVTLRQLESMGAALSIDHFGTRHSSLADVRRYPIAMLKIDGAFVSGLLDNRHDCAVVTAVVGLANALDLRVIAEGVESREQLSALEAMGCHAAQGFYIAGPLAPNDVTSWLHRSDSAGPGRTDVSSAPTFARSGCGDGIIASPAPQRA